MSIEINLKIILLGAMYFLLNKFDIYIIFLLSILFHEISHMFVGILFGFKPQKIRINPFGLSLKFYSYNKKSRLKKIITYLAGPLSNLFIAFCVINLKFEENLKEKIYFTNILLMIVNLIPILPLDGGKILKEILSKYMNIKKTNILMINISKAVLIIITILYSLVIIKVKNFVIFLLIIYLWYLQYLENKKVKIVVKTYDTMQQYI